jgi:hypothetical protein
VSEDRLPALIRMVNERGAGAKRAVTDEELRYFARVAGEPARTEAPAGAAQAS